MDGRRFVQKKSFQLLYKLAGLSLTLGLMIFGADLIKNYLLEQNEQLVHSLSQTILPSLLVDDTQQTKELLRSLEAYPSIQRVELTASNGATLYDFSREGDRLIPRSAQLDLASTQLDLLQLDAPITFDNQILGNLQVSINLLPTYMLLISWFGEFIFAAGAFFAIVKHFKLKVSFERFPQTEISNLGLLDFDFYKKTEEIIAEAQIGVAFQPIKNLKYNNLSGFELFFYWKLPSGRVMHLSPAEFEVLAEKWGNVLPLGDYMIRMACKDASKWQKLHGAISMNIDINAKQLRSSNFLKKMQKICEDTGFKFEKINFEINESLIVKEKISILELNHFIQIGGRLTIDGFGLTNESMNLLEHVVVQNVKLSPKLLLRIERDECVRELVKKYSDCANKFDVNLIADGITSQKLSEFISALNCPYGQGSWLGAPMEKQQFQALFV